MDRRENGPDAPLSGPCCITPLKLLPPIALARSIPRRVAPCRILSGHSYGGAAAVTVRVVVGFGVVSEAAVGDGIDRECDSAVPVADVTGAHRALTGDVCYATVHACEVASPRTGDRGVGDGAVSGVMDGNGHSCLPVAVAHVDC